MKKILYILLALIVVLSIIGCKSSSTIEYIKKEINLDISKCHIIEDNDEHSGFLGDGEYFVKAECLDNDENIINQINSWNVLPLSKNLQLIMYGGNGYNYELAKSVGIPEINNGYYYFIDRHSESVDKQSDIDLFNRYSFNFTLALYDNDTNILYYYELDT